MAEQVKGTPTEIAISIALHYHLRSGDYPDIGDELVDNLMNNFVVKEMLVVNKAKDRERDYTPTDGLRMWIDALCGVRMPHREWVMPDAAE